MIKQFYTVLMIIVDKISAKSNQLHSTAMNDVLRKLLIYWSGSGVISPENRLLMDVLTSDEDEVYMTVASIRSSSSGDMTNQPKKMRYPTASTCSMTLYLPKEYVYQDSMHDGLNIILEYGVGFDLA